MKTGWDPRKDGPEHAFHVGNGVFFDKGQDEFVRVVFRDGSTDTVLAELSPTEWASVVAHVSKTGETTAAFYAALNLHKNGA